MADEQKAKRRLEIAHVLFMDIVDYSKLLTDEQSEALQELNQIVRSTEAARAAKAAGENGNPQRPGPSREGCKRARKHCRRRHQHRAARDGLRGCWPHSH